jgi:hypothetical protein
MSLEDTARERNGTKSNSLRMNERKEDLEGL